MDTVTPQSSWKQPWHFSDSQKTKKTEEKSDEGGAGHSYRVKGAATVTEVSIVRFEISH